MTVIHYCNQLHQRHSINEHFSTFYIKAFDFAETAVFKTLPEQSIKLGIKDFQKVSPIHKTI